MVNPAQSTSTSMPLEENKCLDNTEIFQRDICNLGNLGGEGGFIIYIFCGYVVANCKHMPIYRYVLRMGTHRKNSAGSHFLVAPKGFDGSSHGNE